MKKLLLFIVLSVKCLALSEVEIIALTLAGEARGEGTHGMIAVSNVIINRYNKKPSQKISDICLKPYQFSCWSKSGKFLQDAEKIKASKEYIFCLGLAEKMVNRIPIENVVGLATHYHTIQINPYWRDQNKVVCQIKNHIFYKDI